jgi:formylglycine-generating enzyme required for sulfatase activity
LIGNRFPWGNTIDHSQANYWSAGSYAYDVSSTRGFHPIYNDGVFPYTSPVGAFAPNGYGLYDMGGNVFEWCWDGYEDYPSGSVTDPHGNASNTGLNRVFRGGSWYNNPWFCRTADREYVWSDFRSDVFGFRTVLSSGQ